MKFIGYKQSYIKDAVLGGIDGGVSTFAIVAGTIGGGFPSIVTVALGTSSLITDELGSLGVLSLGSVAAVSSFYISHWISTIFQ